MTTKTIPEYLEDERQKYADAVLRIAEDAARIQSLRRSHHRTTKQPKMELLSPVGAAGQGKATAATVGKKPRAARRTATRVHKVA
jgi:hypothetical protein